MSPDLQGRVDRGEIVMIGVYFWRADDNVMELHVPAVMEESEAIAMLKRHGCYPR